MSYHLFNRPGSGGFVVEAALTLAEADFELTELASKAGTPLPESFRENQSLGAIADPYLAGRQYHDGILGHAYPFGRLFSGEEPRPRPRHVGTCRFSALDRFRKRQSLRVRGPAGLPLPVYRRRGRVQSHSHGGDPADGRSAARYRRQYQRPIPAWQYNEFGRYLHRHVLHLA